MLFRVVGSGPDGGYAYRRAMLHRDGVEIVDYSESTWDWSFTFEGTEEDKNYLRSLNKDDLDTREYIDYIRETKR